MHPKYGLSTSGASLISASEAMYHFGDCLTAYERKEIVQYEAVYYAGQRCVDKVKSPTNGHNDGYDTEEGEYIFRVKDHIAYRYEVLEELGSGAFGQVFKAIDHFDESIVAVKLIRNHRKVLQQADQEIGILQRVNDRDPKGLYGIVRMIDNFKFRGHICISYELLGANLYEYLKTKDFFPMALPLIRSIAARMLVTLSFLARENIIHCDLKPENILLRDNDPAVVKVADLGSASIDTKSVYVYIQSRFYRAPEVIMEQKYNNAIDWWSFGCILCELANGDPVFPGNDEKDQLGCIMEYLGPPPQNFIEASSARRKREFFDGHYKPRPHTTREGKQREPGSRSLSKFLAVSEDDDFLSFVRLFLQWDPSQRVSPREAMKHRWICDKFVFPTQSEEKKSGLSSLTKESNASASGSLKGCMSQEPAAPLKPKVSMSTIVGSLSTAREAPVDSLWPSAGPPKAQRSAPLLQPPTTCTGSANFDTSGDNASRVNTLPPSRDAFSGTVTRGAAQSTGAKFQGPSVPQRHNGRLQRGRQRRSTDMADVEIPGEAIALPNNSTSLHAPLGAEESSAEKHSRGLMITANKDSSPVSVRGVVTRVMNPRPQLRLAGGVLSPEVLSPVTLHSSTNPVIVTSRDRNAHSSENEASPSASHSNTNSGAVGNARGNSSAGDVPTSVLELPQEYEGTTAKTHTVDLLGRNGGAIDFSSLSRWRSTTRTSQLNGDRQRSASASARRDSHGITSPGLSTESARGEAVRERREHLVSLNPVDLLPTKASQPAAIQGRPHAGEYMLPSELPPFREGASSSNLDDVGVSPNCRHLAAILSDPRNKGGLTELSLQTRGSPPLPLPGPSAVAAPSLTPPYKFLQRSAQCNIPVVCDDGAAHTAARNQRVVASEASSMLSERRAVQLSGMHLVPPRQVLGRQSLLPRQNGSGTRSKGVTKPSTVTTPQLPLLKR